MLRLSSFEWCGNFWQIATLNRYPNCMDFLEKIMEILIVRKFLMRMMYQVIRFDYLKWEKWIIENLFESKSIICSLLSSMNLLLFSRSFFFVFSFWYAIVVDHIVLLVLCYVCIVCCCAATRSTHWWKAHGVFMYWTCNKSLSSTCWMLNVWHGIRTIRLKLIYCICVEDIVHALVFLFQDNLRYDCLGYSSYGI